jgi:hypothetical protein
VKKGVALLKLKTLLLFVQRFVLVELEAILFIMVIHVFYNWLSFSELQPIDVIWLQLLFILISYPLQSFSSQKVVYIWIAALATISLVVGYHLSVEAPWLPILLAIWRSISLSNETEYLIAIYHRMISMIVFLIFYFTITNLFQHPMWWAIPMLTAGGICFTIMGIASHNLLDQLSWNPKREEWRRIAQNQLIFVTGMIAIVVSLVVVRNKIIFIFTQVLSFSLKAIAFLLAPLIMLLANLISYLYRLLSDSEGKSIKANFSLPEMMEKANVKDTASDYHWIWPMLTIALVICLLLIFVKLIRKMMLNNKLTDVEGEWMEITEQSDLRKRNHLFSFLKNLNPFGKKQDLNEIRLSYIDFLKQYAELAKSYPANSTTRVMMKKAAEGFAVNEEELKQLTKIYEEHRYGGKFVDASSVQRMKVAVGNWLKKEERG